MIPAYVVEKFSAMTEQNIRSSAEFRIRMALRKKLQADNLTHSLISPCRLDATAVEAIAMAPVIAINAHISEGEVLELASGLFSTYQALTSSYSKERFEHPVLASLQDFKKFTLEY